ncbi:MAG TPA: hypothetical protein VLO11_11145 [Luteolibacter sp.]|nr:hypothetical protein [Luteolibacter sp.]
MKNTLILALIGFALGMVSCRTAAPLDPMTMEPSDRCTPGAAVTHSSK